MTGRRRIELLASTRLSQSVQSLIFGVADGEQLVYRAGQYVELYPPSSSGLEGGRPYSIASPFQPTPPHPFEIAVTRVNEGPTSEALHDLAVGTSIELEGPRGTFTRDPSLGRAALFVATGTGLSPLRAMLTEELEAEDGPNMTLLFGARTEDDLLWDAELRALTQTRPRFRYVPTLSRGSSSWQGRRGHVQAHLFDLHAPSNDGEVYVCGLPPMVEDVLAVLLRAGVPRERLRFEEYL